MAYTQTHKDIQTYEIRLLFLQDVHFVAKQEEDNRLSLPQGELSIEANSCDKLGSLARPADFYHAAVRAAIAQRGGYGITPSVGLLLSPVSHVGLV